MHTQSRSALPSKVMKFNSTYCHADWIATGIKQSTREFLIVPSILFINNTALKLRAFAICLTSCYTTPPWHFQSSCIGVLQARNTRWASGIYYGPELVWELYRYKFIGHYLKLIQGKMRVFVMHCMAVSFFSPRPVQMQTAVCLVWAVMGSFTLLPGRRAVLPLREADEV